MNQLELFGNSLTDLGTALLSFIFFLLLFKILQFLVLSRLKNLAQKTKTDIDDTLLKIIQTLKPPFYLFLAFYLSLKLLNLDAGIQKVTDTILIIWVVYQVILAAQVMVDYVVRISLGKEEEIGTREAMKTISRVAKGVLWSIGALFILSNLGVNVTSLVAGLGIGGVAVALALQNVLGDLFSSFAIYFDKPFVAGDFIIVGDSMGVVEKVGIKTTRIRALQGEEIVISNQELTSARIQNFKKMQERRVVFSFGVTYETSSDKLRRLPEMVTKIIESIKDTRFDRAHFYKFDDSALTFEVVYYVGSGDYNRYMDIHQEIHLAIKETFEGEGISMAYPTQTVYLSKSEKFSPLPLKSSLKKVPVDN